MSNVLKVTELAEALRVGRSAAYQLVREGEIRSIRVGRAIRIPAEALDEYLSGKKSAESVTSGLHVE